MQMHFSIAPKVVTDNIQANISKTQAAIPGAQVAPGQASSAHLQGSRFGSTNIETEFK